MISSGRVEAGHIRHDLFVYDSDDRFALQVMRYVIAGLDREEPMTVVVDARKQAILRDVLGPDATLVSFIEPAEVYTRPAAAMARYDTVVQAPARVADAGHRVYGELLIHETQAEWDRWMTYESVVNRVFEGRGATLMCGYDTRLVPEPVIQQARQTHRVVLDDSWHLSPDYTEPEALVPTFTPAFEDLPALRSLDVADPSQLQDRLADELAEISIPEGRARDLLVAAREVLVNARRYGRGVRALRVGRVGEHVVCEVSDSGRGLDDPLAGYRPPRPLADDGAGLWIARQLTSRVDLHQEPEGLTVRLWG